MSNLDKIWQSLDMPKFLHAKMVKCQITCQGMLSYPLKLDFQNGKACLYPTKINKKKLTINFAN